MIRCIVICEVYADTAGLRYLLTHGCRVMLYQDGFQGYMAAGTVPALKILLLEDLK
jgi:hypothetical protein